MRQYSKQTVLSLSFLLLAMSSVGVSGGAKPSADGVPYNVSKDFDWEKLPNAFTITVMVFSDYEHSKLFENNQTNEDMYIEDVFATATARFSQLKDPQVFLCVTEIVHLNETESYSATKQPAKGRVKEFYPGRASLNFKSYVKENYANRTEHVYFLMTGYPVKMIGSGPRSFENGAVQNTALCSDKVYAVFGDRLDPRYTLFAVTHMFGKLLGAWEDSGSPGTECSADKGYIMGSYEKSKEREKQQFSPCSLTAINETFKTRKEYYPQCFNVTPTKNELEEFLFENAEKYPESYCIEKGSAANE